MFIGILLRDTARDFGVEFESLRHREIRELKQEDFSRRRCGEIREGTGLSSSFSSQI